jgi:hypothetical protein
VHSVESAFRHRLELFGPFKAGIYGATQPDYLHQWLEGLGKYIPEWVQLLIEREGRGSLADFDARFSCVNVRHSDKDMVSKPFANGVSKIKALPAKEVIPLLMQLPIAIGVEGTFLGATETKEVFEVIDQVLHLLKMLMQDECCEQGLACLDVAIKRFLGACKDTFGCVVKSFCFFKFHMATCSTARGIRLFGRLAITDASRLVHRASIALLAIITKWHCTIMSAVYSHAKVGVAA